MSASDAFTPPPAPPPTAAAPADPSLPADAADAPQPAAPSPLAANMLPTTYAAAEERGFSLYKAGEYERAIRMFELAQTLPGAGVDYTREKQGGMIGSAFAPPNPRGWELERYATPQQKLIAQYNIACCCAAMGDADRAVEVLRGYLGQVIDPLDQLNEMLVDSDLECAREGLRVLREELKSSNKGGRSPFAAINDKIRQMAEGINVEWK